MHHWIYHGNLFESIPEGIIGFVYLITNLTNNKKYIGKKNFFFSKTKQVKKKKKRIKVESDWKDYWSSSDQLKNDVQSLGYDKFKREIIYLCTNKAQMSYLELREQIDNRVLESNCWYNGWISARVRKTNNIIISN